MTVAIGVDVGGTGIKAAAVDTGMSTLVGPRLAEPTPPGGEPGDVARVVAGLVRRIEEATDERDAPVGVAVPSVVVGGRTRTAANISPAWIGLPAAQVLSTAVGRPVGVLNDADAAGWAEVHDGAATGEAGLVIVLTLGTGIGSALVHDGVLVPNTELGHLEIDGHRDYEQYASPVAREREGIGWDAWRARLRRYLETLEALLTPTLFVIGGGISLRPELFLPGLDGLATPVRPARHAQDAGIIGAAERALLG
jgi:polyphosphate glucokinase